MHEFCVIQFFFSGILPNDLKKKNEDPFTTDVCMDGAVTTTLSVCYSPPPCVIGGGGARNIECGKTEILQGEEYRAGGPSDTSTTIVSCWESKRRQES